MIERMPRQSVKARALSVFVRIACAFALLLVATYYLLASIPFGYYQFLQVAHFWWMAPFIRIHPLVLAAAVGGFLLTLRGRPAWLTPWIRYVAVAAGTITVCMAVIVWQPLLLTYPAASVLCFVPLALLAMLSGIDLAAHRDHAVARLFTNASRGVPPSRVCENHSCCATTRCQTKASTLVLGVGLQQPVLRIGGIDQCTRFPRSQSMV